MARVKWKGPLITIEPKKQEKTIKARFSEITPNLIDSVFYVHNGKSYSEIKVTSDMLGHKFGEFVFTRAKFSFKRKKNKK